MRAFSAPRMMFYYLYFALIQAKALAYIICLKTLICQFYLPFRIWSLFVDLCCVLGRCFLLWQLLNCHNSCNCQTLTPNVILFVLHLSLIGGPFSPNEVFYRSETLLYTSWNHYFIKQHHQIATIDIQKVWHLLSKFHSCNCCDSWSTVRVEQYGLRQFLSISVNFCRFLSIFCRYLSIMYVVAF
jgi:hypothetical protein